MEWFHGVLRCTPFGASGLCSGRRNTRTRALCTHFAAYCLQYADCTHLRHQGAMNFHDCCCCCCFLRTRCVLLADVVTRRMREKHFQHELTFSFRRTRLRKYPLESGKIRTSFLGDVCASINARLCVCVCASFGGLENLFLGTWRGMEKAIGIGREWDRDGDTRRREYSSSILTRATERSGVSVREQYSVRVCACVSERTIEE